MKPFLSFPCIYNEERIKEAEKLKNEEKVFKKEATANKVVTRR